MLSLQPVLVYSNERDFSPVCSDEHMIQSLPIHSTPHDETLFLEAKALTDFHGYNNNKPWCSATTNQRFVNHGAPTVLEFTSIPSI